MKQFFPGIRVDHERHYGEISHNGDLWTIRNCEVCQENLRSKEGLLLTIRCHGSWEIEHLILIAERATREML